MSDTAIQTPKRDETPAIQPLVGRADHRLDPQKRFTIPSDWYERMGRPSSVYVMPSLSRSRCLDVFPPSEFDKRLEKFRNAALSDVAKASFLSRIGELVTSCSLDVQNRIRVKSSLLAFAGVTGDLVLIGAGYHFEIWSLAHRPKLDGSEAAQVDSIVSDAQAMGF